ncbi:MAG: GatB/YqeY domain-containing protein [Clostridia bacterium]|nr:GatB/YqeY domain-containing protein [Clostridia bacterium]
MSIKEQLKQDLVEAMKAKDTIRKNTVQMARAGILQVEKDQRIELDDNGVIEVLAREVKKRKDVLPDYEKSGRTDLVADLNREIEVLMAYLPEQMSEAEVEEIVKAAIAETGASGMKEMGKVMAAVMPKTKGRADGKLVNTLVKKLLS